MRKRGRFLIPPLTLAVVATIVLWGRLENGKKQQSGTVEGNGVIEATEVNISAKVAGKIQMLGVREGDEITEGQLIATLDSGELEGQVLQAQGNLAAAEANLAELTAGTRIEEIRRARAQYDAAVRALQQAEAHLDLVKEGPRKEQVEQLRAAYEQAQARLSLVKEGPRRETIEQLRAALKQAEVTLSEAETELRRVETLEAQGAVPRQQVDQARTRRDVSDAQVQAAQQRLAEAKAGARPQELQEAEAQVEAARQKLEEALAGARPQELRAAEAAVAQAKSQTDAAKASFDLALSGARPETIAAARARVEQARGSLQTAQSSQKETQIFSPTSGRISQRDAEVGELVTPGFPIVRIAELQTVSLRVYVPETQVGLVKLGQSAEVRTDTYPDKRYEGQVTEIAEVPEFTPKNVQTKGERVKLVFGVKIEMKNPNQELKPGMPADAVIFVEEDGSR